MPTTKLLNRDQTGEVLDASDRRVRARIVAIARAEVGPGRVADYWRSALGPDYQGPPPRHWCGAFALWCLHQAGAAPDVRWQVDKGILWRLPRAKRPEPGDIAYFHQPYQHHAIVAGIHGPTLVSIDGNQPDVCERRRPLSQAVIYSVTHWLPYEPSDTEPPPGEDHGQEEID